MRIRRIASAAATAAVLGSLLVLSVGTPANAAPPIGEPTAVKPQLEVTPVGPFTVLSKRDYCTEMWNVNYWTGGVQYATTQWNGCMAD